MDEVRERLTRCFQAVFPELSAQDAERASNAWVGGWDSVATVTLAAAVEEEFGIEFEPEEMEELTSFPIVLDRVLVHSE